MNETSGKILIEGNAAAAIGCMMAGVTVVAWYPITPSSSLCESLIGYMKKYRVDKTTGKATFAIVQAEDEIASLGMVVGASWAGARAMTATAGPGISLMSEFAGLAYYAETPAVIFDVQRVGPSTGLPTRTAQGDLLQTAFLSHGDTKHIMLFPCSVEECYTMAMEAFDLAEHFQTPVFVMMDLDLGMNNWMSDPFQYPTRPINRGKLLTPEKLKELGEWGRYKDVDGDGIAYRTIPGDGLPAYFTRGSGHNAKGQYSERPDDYVENMDRLARKFETARKLVPAPAVDDSRRRQDRLHRLRHVALGDRRKAAISCARRPRSKRPISGCAAYPFTEDLARFVDAHDRIYVIEQNRDAQLLQLMKLELTPERADEAAQRPPLQRSADRRAQHHRRCAGAGRVSKLQEAGAGADAAPGSDGWANNNMATKSQSNRAGTAGLQRRQDHAMRRLRPQRDFRAHHRRLLRDGRDPGAGHQAVGHRLLEQEPGVFPRRVARLQRRPRPDAVGRHRRDAGQPEADRHRRQRRRRHGRDRHRPVRAPDAPQSADHLHHRGQRLLRPDQGAVLADRRPRLEAEDRRRQRPAADRYLRARHRARRDVRCAARSRATRSSCCRC